MADQSHTPGPWRLDDPEVGPRDAFIPIGGCGCCGSPWIESIDPCGDGEELANALLIVAAPDLLAALRDVREELYEIRDADSVPVGTEIYLRAMQALETIDAAIAKAEGGNHD